MLWTAHRSPVEPCHPAKAGSYKGESSTADTWASTPPRKMVRPYGHFGARGSASRVLQRPGQQRASAGTGHLNGPGLPPSQPARQPAPPVPAEALGSLPAPLPVQWVTPPFTGGRPGLPSRLPGPKPFQWPDHRSSVGGHPALSVCRPHSLSSGQLSVRRRGPGLPCRLPGPQGYPVAESPFIGRGPPPPSVCRASVPDLRTAHRSPAEARPGVALRASECSAASVCREHV